MPDTDIDIDEPTAPVGGSSRTTNADLIAAARGMVPGGGRHRRQGSDLKFGRRRRRIWPWAVAAVIVALGVAAFLGIPRLHLHLGSGSQVQLADSTVVETLHSSRLFPESAAQTGYPPLPPAAPTVERVATTDPVVFITIDDGWVVDPRVLDLIAQRQAPVTVFPIGNGVLTRNPEPFRKITAFGGSVEDHTWTHPYLSKMPLDQQQNEVCQQADLVQKLYARRPVLMRPPYGAINPDTHKATTACGQYVVVTWDTEIREGKFLYSGVNQLRPGDIILIHFRPETYDELVALFKQMDQLGLKAGRLLDYVGPEATKSPNAPQAPGTTTLPGSPAAPAAPAAPGSTAAPSSSAAPSAKHP